MQSFLGSSSAPPPGAPSAGDVVKESDTRGFQTDVIQASMQVPVLVDFWATWCGPCRQLGPALEKVVRAAGGKVKLVKIDVDRNQALAQQLRIQSIPTVNAFYQGQPVDGFQGALPESQLKAFVEQLVGLAGGGGAAEGPDLAAAVEAGEKLLAEGATAEAAELFAQVLQHDNANAGALSGLLRAQIAAGETKAARDMLDRLPEDLKSRPELQQVATALELAEQAAASGDLGELMERVARDANDHQARFDLAQALYAAGKREATVDALLEIVRRNRGWNEEAARKQLVKYFEAWGPNDPLTLEARRRLSSLLFS